MKSCQSDHHFGRFYTASISNAKVVPELEHNVLPSTRKKAGRRVILMHCVEAGHMLDRLSEWWCLPFLADDSTSASDRQSEFAPLPDSVLASSLEKSSLPFS